ncbi:MAG: hypothetical protein MI919_35830 [Holophagales bacterium]|nr:hypothetical protein [Holophagales bacterium]
MRFGRRFSMLCGLSLLAALAAAGTAHATDLAPPTGSAATNATQGEPGASQSGAPPAGGPKPAPRTEWCSSVEGGADSERRICRCDSQATDPVTRAGVTCQRARQRAKDAARALAVCPPSSEGSCGPVSHSIMPCEDRPGGGFTATAVAFYSCEFCIYIRG